MFWILRVERGNYVYLSSYETQLRSNIRAYLLDWLPTSLRSRKSRLPDKDLPCLVNMIAQEMLMYCKACTCTRYSIHITPDYYLAFPLRCFLSKDHGIVPCRTPRCLLSFMTHAGSQVDELLCGTTCPSNILASVRFLHRTILVVKAVAGLHIHLRNDKALRVTLECAVALA